jgi:hypothetical protein
LVCAKGWRGASFAAGLRGVAVLVDEFAAIRLAHAETPAEMDSAERAVNKLGRTFAALVETLKRYRNGGDHNVVVQNMSIAEGGQAIVGNLTRSARKSEPQKAPKKMTALIDDRQPAAEIIQEPTRVRIPLETPAPLPRRHSKQIRHC